VKELKTMTIKRLVLGVGVFVLAAAPLLAQSQDARGNVVGRVSDPTGAVVPGAEVKGINDATGVTVATKTNEAGNYVLPFLMPGMYTVTAEVQGFRKFERKNIQVRVNENV